MPKLTTKSTSPFDVALLIQDELVTKFLNKYSIADHDAVIEIPSWIKNYAINKPAYAWDRVQQLKRGFDSDENSQKASLDNWISNRNAIAERDPEDPQLKDMDKAIQAKESYLELLKFDFDMAERLYLSIFSRLYDEKAREQSSVKRFSPKGTNVNQRLSA